MILEILEACTYPEFYSQQTRSYLIDSLALKSRYHRLKKPWAPHLQNCHQVIADFLLSVPADEKIEIWGSGHLQEVPLDLLKNRQGSFLDLFFPRPVRAWAQKHHWQCQSQNLSLDFEPLAKYAISCNLLSQIPLFNPDISQAQALASHQRQMEKYSGFLLICDYKKIIRDPRGQVIETHPSADFQKIQKQWGSPQRQWIWPLAPRKEISADFSVELQMAAWLRTGSRR